MGFNYKSITEVADDIRDLLVDAMDDSPALRWVELAVSGLDVRVIYVVPGEFEALVQEFPRCDEIAPREAEDTAEGVRTLGRRACTLRANVAADAGSLARGVLVAGKVEPVFVEDVAEMPAAIRRIAEPGDVVVTMGAGSIGNVPAQLT